MREQSVEESKPDAGCPQHASANPNKITVVSESAIQHDGVAHRGAEATLPLTDKDSAHQPKRRTRVRQQPATPLQLYLLGLLQYMFVTFTVLSVAFSVAKYFAVIDFTLVHSPKVPSVFLSEGSLYREAWQYQDMRGKDGTCVTMLRREYDYLSRKYEAIICSESLYHTRQADAFFELQSLRVNVKTFLTESGARDYFRHAWGVGLSPNIPIILLENRTVSTATLGDESLAFLYDGFDTARVGVTEPNKLLFHTFRVGRTVVKAMATGPPMGAADLTPDTMHLILDTLIVANIRRFDRSQAWWYPLAQGVHSLTSPTLLVERVSTQTKAIFSAANQFLQQVASVIPGGMLGEKRSASPDHADSKHPAQTATADAHASRDKGSQFSLTSAIGLDKLNLDFGKGLLGNYIAGVTAAPSSSASPVDKAREKSDSSKKPKKKKKKRSRKRGKGKEPIPSTDPSSADVGGPKGSNEDEAGANIKRATKASTTTGAPGSKTKTLSQLPIDPKLLAELEKTNFKQPGRVFYDENSVPRFDPRPAILPKHILDAVHRTRAETGNSFKPLDPTLLREEDVTYGHVVTLPPLLQPRTRASAAAALPSPPATSQGQQGVSKGETYEEQLSEWKLWSSLTPSIQQIPTEVSGADADTLDRKLWQLAGQIAVQGVERNVPITTLAEIITSIRNGDEAPQSSWSTLHPSDLASAMEADGRDVAGTDDAAAVEIVRKAYLEQQRAQQHHALMHDMLVKQAERPSEFFSFVVVVLIFGLTVLLGLKS